jgi:hypothetical protein
MTSSTFIIILYVSTIYITPSFKMSTHSDHEHPLKVQSRITSYLIIPSTLASTRITCFFCIITFQQFTGFDHHVKCPAVHGGLDQILRHRCPVTTAYLCYPHSSFF